MSDPFKTARDHPTARVESGGKICDSPACAIDARAGAPKMTQMDHPLHPATTYNQKDGMTHSTAGVRAPTKIDPTALGATVSKRNALPTRTVGTRHRNIDELGGADVGENIARGNAFGGPDHPLGQRVLDEGYAASDFHTQLTRRKPTTMD